MTIQSNPPGALAYVDGRQIGITPVTTPFLYYGRREIRLVKDGFVMVKDGQETSAVIETIWPPWYEIPPIDFVSENLVSGKLRDQRTLTYELRPQVVVPTDQLLARAQALRQGTAAAARPLPPPAIRADAPSTGWVRAAAPVAAPAADVPAGSQPFYPLPSPGPLPGSPPGP